MEQITIEAPAKLNLWLEVYDRLESGYHSIFSVMHSTGLCDTLNLTRKSGGITLDCDYIHGYRGQVPDDASNLAYRAAEAFFACASEYDPSFADNGAASGAAIRLVKRIPTAAGLGGGSSDAAAVLRGLNLLYGNPVPAIKLREAGRGLGADVPFCIAGGSAAVSGIGDVLNYCPPLPECHVVIAIPDAEVHTGSAYAALDALSYTRRTPDKMLDALASGSLDGVCGELFNRFEDITPVAEPLKKLFTTCGAKGTLMSGSGPSVFGLFRDSGSALESVQTLRGAGYEAFFCG